LLLQNAGAFNQGGGVEQSESGVEQQGLFTNLTPN